MESFDLVEQIRLRESDPLSTNVRGFDGAGFESHGDTTKATVIAPVMSPVALALMTAADRAQAIQSRGC